jgi:hypothetical protein
LDLATSALKAVRVKKTAEGVTVMSVAALPAIKLTVPFNGWIMPAVRLSDHASFWGEGFKAVMITDSAFYRNPHYHLPTDRMNTLDFRFMAELVESLATFLAQRR